MAIDDGDLDTLEDTDQFDFDVQHQGSVGTPLDAAMWSSNVQELYIRFSERSINPMDLRRELQHWEAQKYG